MVPVADRSAIHGLVSDTVCPLSVYAYQTVAYLTPSTANGGAVWSLALLASGGRGNTDQHGLSRSVCLFCIPILR